MKHKLFLHKTVIEFFDNKGTLDRIRNYVKVLSEQNEVSRHPYFFESKQGEKVFTIYAYRRDFNPENCGLYSCYLYGLLYHYFAGKIEPNILFFSESFIEDALHLTVNEFRAGLCGLNIKYEIFEEDKYEF